jgi:predicted nucleotide-binding protein
MDDTTALVMALSALQKTYEALQYEAKMPSSSTADQLSALFREVNDIFPKAHLPTTLSIGAAHSEVLRQIELALKFLGHGTSTAKGAQEKPERGDAESEVPQKAKPKIFIGCSTQGLTEAEIIQMLLQESGKVDPVIWNQGVFGLMSGTLETLVAKAAEYNFAVLVLTPDDVLVKKDREVNAARDNVLFELGLFMGALGRQRTFVVTEESVNLPSDLAGITVARFKRGGGADIVSNMGPVVTKLKLGFAATQSP